MSEVVLEVKNISKKFQLHRNSGGSLKEAVLHLFKSRGKNDEDFCALNNVSFEVKQGEALGIIGKNGAGKSTLLRLLSGITQPDEGEINFYGKAVSILDIGAGFHPELSGRENIYLSASLYKFERAEIEAKFDGIVEFSGIGKFIDEPVKNYSSGMYLRLAFSIITFLEADIYLLDEVINVGDANFQEKCKNRMEELIAAGKTMLIASHNFNEVVTLCNRVILIESGKITTEGGTDVIQKYMTQALPQYFSFHGHEFYHLKECSEIQTSLANIKIKNFGLKDFSKISDGLNPKHSLKIFFDVETLNTLRFIVRLKVYDSTGILAFVCSSLKNISESTAVGNYKIEFEIPENIFNNRMYSVDFSVIDMDNKSLLLKEDKFLTFKMGSDESSTTDEIRDYSPGIIKPYVITRIFKTEV